MATDLLLQQTGELACLVIAVCRALFSPGEPLARRWACCSPCSRSGFLGFWLKTLTPDIEVAVVVDDPASGDRGLPQPVVADGEWHLYEWDLGDDDQWEAWAFGDGLISDPTTTLDSIHFFGSGNALIYLDEVAHNPYGRLLAGLVAGDYDGNGLVDAGDYMAWQDQFGQSVPPGTGADGNGDGLVNAADYTIWQNHRGASLASTSSLAPQPIPEPTTLALAALLCGLLLLPRKR